MPASRAARPNVSDTDWLPWSESWISPGRGRRRASVVCSASTTSSARMWSGTPCRSVDALEEPEPPLDPGWHDPALAHHPGKASQRGSEPAHGPVVTAGGELAGQL